MVQGSYQVQARKETIFQLLRDLSTRKHRIDLIVHYVLSSLLPTANQVIIVVITS